MPDARVGWEETDRGASGEIEMLFWAETSDFEAFEAAMEADPTVGGARQVTEFGDRRLYQICLQNAGHETEVYSHLTAAGAIIRVRTGTAEGWYVEVAFPDQATFTAFVSLCEDHELDLKLLKKYRQRTSTGARDGYGLSEKQRETLRIAHELGYFEVPRDNHLETIAEELGISHQALSERFRRGTGVLVENTICDPTVSTND